MTDGKLLISWSHPPESNRRPADYELARSSYIIDFLWRSGSIQPSFSATSAVIEHNFAHDHVKGGAGVSPVL
jgi:hypothetical protein